jgi:hypothetical protein
MTGISAIGGMNNLFQTQRVAAPAQNTGATDADEVKTTPRQTSNSDSATKASRTTPSAEARAVCNLRYSASSLAVYSLADFWVS